MSIENSKNYTGSEDVYRNMNKANELLERALGLLEGSHYQDLVEEIRAYLEEPVVAESAYVVVNENGNYMRVNPKRKPLSEKEIEEINKSIHPKTDLPTAKILFARAIEKHHGIGGGE